MEDHPLARGTDPETSHAAAEAMRPRLSSIQVQVLGILRAGARPDHDLIESYRARHGFASESTIRTRRAELARAGLIRVVGEARTPAGQRAQVWGVVDGR